MGRNQNKSWQKPKRQSEVLDDKMEVENTPPPPAKRPKQAEWTKEAVVPSEKFDVLGGCEEQFLKACRLSVHMRFPEIYERLGVVAPKGFLLHGPPGTGKTTFAKALAGELNLPLISVSSTEVVAGISGESEKRIREVFAKAAESAPAILLLDDIDVIAAKRENAQREMERRIVAQLIASMDELENTRILVIGTTSRLEVLDSSLRRAGRFDKDISIGIPDERARSKILEIVTKDLKMDGNITLQQLARLTPGYVGADLKAFVREASLCAVDRIFENVLTNNDPHSHNGTQKMEHIVLELQKMRDWLNSPPVDFTSKLENICVEVGDFRRALSIVVPSAKREGFATVPDVSWSDIGALRGIRRELEWSILKPIQQPEVFDALNFSPKPQGILLCGPPGCGKTLLGKAIAHEAGMNFISVKGPELISMYVGESERAVRTIFQRANDSSPCVIFFDEIDALCPKRSNFENRKQVFLIGATNRPDMVDPAILRPGRLDRTLYVGFPTAEDRTEILMKITKDGRHPRISENIR
ncbi:ATPase family associated with various cellular activities (AAA) domain-containing protein [Ditylenchus destructor]|nr:ATPase family associated with various cellular activities (AAA) domain-containing protein [Ditylenchus destructor]